MPSPCLVLLCFRFRSPFVLLLHLHYYFHVVRRNMSSFVHSVLFVFIQWWIKHHIIRPVSVHSHDSALLKHTAFFPRCLHSAVHRKRLGIKQRSLQIRVRAEAVLPIDAILVLSNKTFSLCLVIFEVTRHVCTVMMPKTCWCRCLAEWAIFFSTARRVSCEEKPTGSSDRRRINNATVF